MMTATEREALEAEGDFTEEEVVEIAHATAFFMADVLNGFDRDLVMPSVRSAALPVTPFSISTTVQ